MFRTLLVFALLLAGCGPKPVVKVHDRARGVKIDCMALRVVPPQKTLESAFRALYPFRRDCPFTLEVQHKENIRCNSTQNVQAKCLGRMPRHFLRMTLREGPSPLYEYYVDLDGPPGPKEAKRAFGRMADDLRIVPNGV